MHEMSIASNILEIAEREMDGHRHLLSITVEIGELAGVEIEALKFCFQAIRESSNYPELELYIQKVPGEGECEQCGNKVGMEELYALCPDCGSFSVRPVRGRELKVTSIEVE